MSEHTSQPLDRPTGAPTSAPTGGPMSAESLRGPWTIETLARNGEVLHRHRVAALPIRMGRAYDNDFIVDDDYAAAHHAVVEAGPDGRLRLRDLGSRNGIVHKSRRIKDELALDGDTVVRMGHTSLRIRGAAQRVAPEMVDRTMHGWEGMLPGGAGIVLAVLAALLVAWLTDASNDLERYALFPAAASGIGLAWAGLWAFGNRLFGRRARLGRHLFIYGCALAALVGLRLLASVVAYAWSLEWLTAYASHAAVATVAVAVYFHLATVTPQYRRRLRLACGALALLVSSLILAGNMQRHGRTADELYMPVLLPPELRASPDVPVADYIDQVGAMKKEIDAERSGGN
ncbi:FHA domain-containing protein [Massilia timonae]|uniref:FHA domain-containing protein n=1 Tax=Massilia timonae CCUG 45783 TaxID=883126 RepID=K9DVC4_9BURK|nr:FHA domain-containing protein [Massilia timonae]EKU82642.1 hypothetical protein HMPREF9710_02269 [Massilia timonae CCUG 45783]